MTENGVVDELSNNENDNADRRAAGIGNGAGSTGSGSVYHRLPILAPGECRPDFVVKVTGTLLYCLQLSPSFSFLTLRLLNNNNDENNSNKKEEEEEVTTTTAALFVDDILDVLLTRKDGWRGNDDHNNPLDDIQKIWRLRNNNNNEQRRGVVDVTVRGYPERMRPKCPTDTDCIRLHALAIQIEDRSYEAEQQEPPRAEQPTNVSVPDPPTNKKNSNRGANDGSRFGKVVEFLLAEFGGYDGLLSGGPVLDVAGGAGGLAFELAVRNSVPCIVVDPRPVKYKGYQLRHLEFRRHSLELLSTAPECSTMARNLQNRFQIQGFRQLSTLLETSRVLVDDNTCLDIAQKELYDLLHNQQCSVLVGLHPDEATIPIVDIGLALQIPWVVVPCCVFPNLFQSRLLKSGKRVRSYDDLCQFITEKDPDNIRQAVLPFRGRNLALYWHPSNNIEHKIES